MNKINSVVFHINSLGRGGAERVVSIIADRLVRDGVAVSIITLWQATDEYDIDDRIERINIEELCADKGYSGKQLAVMRFLTLRRLIKEKRPDIVISFCNKANFRASIAMLGMRVPLLTSVRNDPLKDYAPYKLPTFIMKLRANGCVFQTGDAMKYFGGRLAKRGRVILNPLHGKYVNCDPWQGKAGGYIMTAGRLSRQKDHELLICAYANIANKYPDVDLRIYGEESEEGYGKKLRDYIDEIDIAARVHLMGNSLHIEKELAGAICFVLSSDYEGMPNALMEALAVGVPSISTDCPCGGPASLIVNNESGILVPVGDVEAMTAALDKMLSDRMFRQSVSVESVKLRNIANADRVYEMWKDYIRSVCR